MAINTRHIGRSYGSLLPSFAAVGACDSGTCRDDPIPPGVYWYDDIDAAAFDDPATVEILREGYEALLSTAFLTAFKVIRTTHHDASMNVPLPMGAPIIGKPDNPARDWVLFQVLSPIPRWPAGTGWGLPTVAPRGVDTQEGDTVQKPPPEPGFFDEDYELPWWGWVLGVTVIGAVAYGVAK